MSQVRSHFKIIISLTMAALFALSCSRGGGGQTQFSKNMEADAGKPAPTYEEWVSLVGQEKADALYAGVGQDSLNILSYGIGISNMVNFINAVTNPQAMVAMIGNDFTNAVVGEQGPGGKTGLGSLVILALLKNVDAQAQAPVTVTSNLPPNPGYCGGAAANSAPCTIDVVTKLASIVNMLQTAGTLKTKMVALFGPSGFNLQRNMSGANDLLFVQRMSRVVAHVDGDVPSANCATAGRVCRLLQDLTPAEVTGKLAPLITFDTPGGLAYANKLVETIQVITYANIGARMVPLVQGVTTPNITAKMAPILKEVTDCTKMGYVVNNVTSIPTLVNMLNNVTSPVRMGKLINGIENPATWTTIQTDIATNFWAGGSQTWGSPVKAAPYATAGTGVAGNVAISGGLVTAINITAPGSGYHPDLAISNVFAGCGTQPTLHLNIREGTVLGGYIANPGAGCTDSPSIALTFTDPTTTSGMVRLKDMINGTPAAEYFKILNLLDTINDGATPENKLILLVQDGRNVNDLIQMLDLMTPNTTGGATCTGTVTITGGSGAPQATATGFTDGTGLAYINVVTGGTYTPGNPPTTLTDSVCGVIPATFVMNAAGTAVTMVSLNALPVNSMAQLVQGITSMSVLPRLREVVDGQRIFGNSGTQPSAGIPAAGSYLYKMVTLLTNLSQPLDGPLKVTQLLNGVTNTDKIIDLIYDVTVTANLSTIINGIFSASLGTGCSDAAVSAYDASLAVCDNLSGTVTAGNGYVYGPKGNAVNTLVYVVQNVSSTTNLVAMINGASPTQMKDLINHVSVGSQVEDPNSGTCGTCSGAAAATSTYSAAGMKLVKIIEFAGLNPHDLSWVINNVSAVIKMAKLINFMQIGQTAAGAAGPATSGTGKVGDLLVKVLSPSGNCWGANGAITGVTGLVGGAGYTSGATVTFAGGGTNAVGVATVNASGVITSINVANDGSGYAAAALTITPVNGGAGASATSVIGSCGTTRGLQQTAGTNPLSNIGKGKIVNMIEYISGTSHTAAMTQLANVINGVNDSQKLGDLINNVQKSSNVVALLNAVLDSYNNNGGSTSNLVQIVNSLPAAEIHKLTSLIQQLNPAVETTLDTLPQADQDLVAQLMAPYASLTASSVVTMTATSPGKVTWAGHGLLANRQVVFSTTGTLPVELNANQLYFVRNPLAGNFEVSATPGGASINFSGTGTPTITAIASEPTATSGVGPATMTQLLGSLPLTNSGPTNYTGYGAAPLIAFGAGCTIAPTATAVVGTGIVTRVSLTVPLSTDPDCTAGSVASIAPGTTNAAVSAVTTPFANRTGGASNNNPNESHRSIYLTDGGTGYGPLAPAVSFSGTCSNVTGNAYINGLTKININTAGSGCTSAPTVTVGAGAPTDATAIALVAGPIATLSNLSGGRGYIATNTCPITGAGGTGGTVTITTIGGVGDITAMAVASGGSDYLIGQTVTIGGAATAHAVVDAAGAITGYVIDNPGCGYVGGLTATIAAGSCSGIAPVPGAVSVGASGNVTGIALGTAGTGCVRNPRVLITGGTSHGDAATATVATSTGGTLVAITMSPAANNLSQVLANTEKGPLTAAINYGNNIPTISAREAMVRLMVHGVTYNGGQFPGVGPAHLGYNVMGSLNTNVAIMTVINMLNNDTISLADLDVLIGCGDQVFYGPSSTTDFEAVCRANAYW